MDFLIHWPPGPVVATVQCQGLMRSQGKRPGCGSRQACRPRRCFQCMTLRQETLTGHYFILKFDCHGAQGPKWAKLKEYFSIYNVIVTE